MPVWESTSHTHSAVVGEVRGGVGNDVNPGGHGSSVTDILRGKTPPAVASPTPIASSSTAALKGPSYHVQTYLSGSLGEEREWRASGINTIMSSLGSIVYTGIFSAVSGKAMEGWQFANSQIAQLGTIARVWELQ